MPTPKVLMLTTDRAIDRRILAEADALGVPMVVGSAVRQLLSISAATEGVDADMTEMAKTVEAWAGVQIGRTPNA